MAKRSNSANPAAKLYGAGAGFVPEQPVPIGGVVLRSDEIEYNVGRPVTTLTVRNTGDRPIQVGSHFHFFEVNRYLEFDREAAFGTHLNIPATTAIRFEPGDERKVEVVPFAGKRRVIGFNSLVMGYAGVEDDPVYYPARAAAFARMHAEGYACCCTKRKHSKNE
ncbi:MAG: urease subunit beta [Rikenellaceae bacterium]|nr:urease subunit beta [Rikenellaceae bacterium]